MTGTALAEALFNGLSFSSILILTALGLAITFGVMRVINMAHGEMLMVGAYTGVVVTSPAFLGLSFFWAIPISFLVVGLVGYLLEMCLIRFLYTRPLDTLLATWGVGLVFQQTIRTIFESGLRQVATPPVLAGSWEIGDATFPFFRLFIIGFTCLCLAAVYFWFYRTPLGLQVRAVTQNRGMASALGISTRRIDSLTFAFGTALAGVAGCIFGCMYNVKPEMGTEYIVDAFMVVILGGVGQLLGTIAGGAVIGTSNGVVAKLLGNELMAKVIVLLIVIAFIQFRPSGLFAVKERTYD